MRKERFETNYGIQTYKKLFLCLENTKISIDTAISIYFEESKENEFNLNVPRYVDISELEDEVDIQATIDELKKLESEKQELRCYC